MYNIDVVLKVRGVKSMSYSEDSRGKYYAMVKDMFGENVSVLDFETVKIEDNYITTTLQGMKLQIEKISFQLKATLGFPDSKTFNKFKITNPEYFGNIVDGRLTVFLKAKSYG